MIVDCPHIPLSSSSPSRKHTDRGISETALVPMSTDFTGLAPIPNGTRTSTPHESTHGTFPSSSNSCCEELLPLHSQTTRIMQEDASSHGREIAMHPDDADIDGMLDITLHHASNIHNICIYGKQDVYAKFSITQTQDTVYSTQPVRGGGKNPVFNQSLQILISKLNAVLKCELWMMSCARNYLQDQLLGFVLVPLCDLMGMGKLTRDYSLTSTELFHTPAGTVCLSLMFYKRSAQPLLSDMVPKLSAGENGAVSCTHMLEENGNAAVDYNSIEFPDLQVASENQELVSMYMEMVSSSDSNMDDVSNNGGDSQQPKGVKSVIQGGPAQARDDAKDVSQKHTQATRGTDHPKLEFGKLSLEGDCEMALNNGEEETQSGSSDHAFQRLGMLGNVVLPSPTSTSNHPNALTRGASVSKEQMSNTKASFNVSVSSNSSQAIPSPTSVSSGGGLSSPDDKRSRSVDRQESTSSFTDPPPPLVSISLDPEVPVVQQQIVDMYMKSMQQFTESLAKMKLPFDMDGTAPHETSSSERLNESPQESKKGAVAASEQAAKDGPRVFYGSRAFF